MFGKSRGHVPRTASDPTASMANAPMPTTSLWTGQRQFRRHRLLPAGAGRRRSIVGSERFRRFKQPGLGGRHSAISLENIRSLQIPTHTLRTDLNCHRLRNKWLASHGLRIRCDSDFDIRHTFTSGVTYELPAPGWNNVSHAALGGWSVDTFVFARTAPLAGWLAELCSGTASLCIRART